MRDTDIANLNGFINGVWGLELGVKYSCLFHDEKERYAQFDEKNFSSSEPCEGFYLTSTSRLHFI